MAKKSPGGVPPGAQPQQMSTQQQSTSATSWVKLAVAGLLALYAILFLALNSEPTTVNFVFFRARAPLFVALGIMLLIGLVVGAGLVFTRDREKAKQYQQTTGRRKKR